VYFHGLIYATVYTAGISLANDETITNSTDGTVLINGTVAGGTGSAAGVFTSNGDISNTGLALVMWHCSQE
jgi:hypothetical protein